ncbi:MAG: A/G-specific adenine glycosylase [Gemmatimonadetes bacterium]|nr:A/G-specific adenine glycosylase [Gemmatimonadota bacterium]MBT8479600.1 A/G-specific adenine glycosylase [Gemmatimonadota bacterium]NNK49294.1 A/G-specific adenine glycosylase [Gemmatimonadota bacterium]
MTGAAGRLLEWFRSRHRDVPGRNEADPYRIWVAEVMAQQTRISTVISYYEPFLERFPDIETLASSSLDDVLKAWEGLGYYGRARNLHRAAGEVRTRYGGRLPEDPVALRSLPGIGAYTAGAVASIAFGRPEPAVDGNVRRVLCRLYDLEKPTAGELDAQCRELIAEAPGASGLLNQALMDLGSSICVPRNPECKACPVAVGCLALANGTIASRPERPRRRPIPHHDVAAALVWRGPRLLIARRPEAGLLGGLWEFPGGKVESGETPAEAARREVHEEMGLDIEILSALEEIKHAYSHFRITLHLFHARWLRGEADPSPPTADSPRWVLPADLGRYAFPAANHAVIRRLLRGEERTPAPHGLA